ncbi:amidohydrolase [Aciduricibacillus chroicocephali]|uniref:Peptidase M20 domain-containing protein 2 n=1 Tax=Aciduricibacillus chroicocephali TaxID=3054939 RepID=A0ABY9KXD3_9BACI|nr:amidohydrolase [Bacillaceae bacterium 44XB]
MKPLAELKGQFLQELSKLKEVAFNYNYDLAEHPEISGHEFETVKKIYSILEDNNLKIEKELGGLPTAFKATVKEDVNSDVRIGILMEFDALPEVGHACGHSASGSLSMLAALALSKMTENLEGNIDLIGTPDEEVAGRKIDLGKQGYFDNYNYVIMIHMNSNVTWPAVKFLALSDLEINFTGMPAHASASPWEGKNALNGAMLALHGMDMLRQHVKSDTRISSIITKGGESTNVIPAKAQIQTALRSSDRAYLDKVEKKVKKCADGAAMATETEVEYHNINADFADMKLNEPGIDTIRDVMRELDVPFEEDDGSMLASSDIGNVSHICPAFHPMLAVSDKYFAHHTPEFAAAMKTDHIRDVIEIGAKIIGFFILTTLTDPELLKKIKQDFAENK